LLKKKKKGSVIIISSPSGAGKTTIAKKLVSTYPNIVLSVSLTTRKARANEINGKDYKFVSKKLFKKKISDKSFLEHAIVFDNFYGTLKNQVFKNINKGKNVLLDIDWQGARQVKKNIPDNIISIFILPPSLKELKKRLLNREKNLSFVKKRMSKAKKEITHWKEYDFAIVNDNLQNCLTKIINILNVSMHKSNRQFI